jgi:hypothetical protein
MTLPWAAPSNCNTFRVREILRKKGNRSGIHVMLGRSWETANNTAACVQGRRRPAVPNTDQLSPESLEIELKQIVDAHTPRYPKAVLLFGPSVAFLRNPPANPEPSI